MHEGYVPVESVVGRKNMAEEGVIRSHHHHALDDAPPNHGDQLEAVCPNRLLAREDGFVHVVHTHEESAEGELCWAVQDQLVDDLGKLGTEETEDGRYEVVRLIAIVDEGKNHDDGASVQSF